MKQTLCDICNKPVRDDDIRYIDFTKIVKGQEDNEVKPVHPTLELCVGCMEEKYKEIIGGN